MKLDDDVQITKQTKSENDKLAVDDLYIIEMV